MIQYECLSEYASQCKCCRVTSLRKKVAKARRGVAMAMGPADAYLACHSDCSAGFTGFHILALLSTLSFSHSGGALRHLRHSTLALTPRPPRLQLVAATMRGHLQVSDWLPKTRDSTVRRRGRKRDGTVLGSAFTLPAGNDNYATS